MTSVQRSMCAGMLGLQAVVLLLTTPVMLSLTVIPTALGLTIGLGLTVACVVVAGMLRRPGGMTLGWMIQIASVAMGFLVPTMFAIGLIFLALWAGAYFLGARIDRERAERSALG